MAFNRPPSTGKIECDEPVTSAILSFSRILNPHNFLARLLLLLQRELVINRIWKSAFNPFFRRSLALFCLLTAPACTTHGVKLVHPQSGAAMECSGSGFGLGSAWVQGHIDDCIRRGESRGFAQVDKLTQKQRLSLESRGLLPKSDGAAAASK